MQVIFQQNILIKSPYSSKKTTVNFLSTHELQGTLIQSLYTSFPEQIHVVPNSRQKLAVSCHDTSEPVKKEMQVDGWSGESLVEYRKVELVKGKANLGVKF